MNQRIICKTLAVAVIILFLGLVIQPSVAVQPEVEIESEPSGLLWGTYRNCEIDGEYWGMIWPLWIRFFSLVVFNIGFTSCRLSGDKGTIKVRSVLGFGFVGEIFPSFDPRTRGSISGSLLFCIYIKDLG